jgi:hypothetical protein
MLATYRLVPLLLLLPLACTSTPAPPVGEDTGRWQAAVRRVAEATDARPDRLQWALEEPDAVLGPQVRVHTVHDEKTRGVYRVYLDTQGERLSPEALARSRAEAWRTAGPASVPPGDEAREDKPRAADIEPGLRELLARTRPEVAVAVVVAIQPRYDSPPVERPRDGEALSREELESLSRRNNQRHSEAANAGAREVMRWVQARGFDLRHGPGVPFLHGGLTAQQAEEVARWPGVTSLSQERLSQME